MSEPSGTTLESRCDVCGGTPKPDPAAAAAAEPVTHCEWCGAEYPVPVVRSAPDETPRRGVSGGREGA